MGLIVNLEDRANKQTLVAIKKANVEIRNGKEQATPILRIV